jgi:aspartokinase
MCNLIQYLYMIKIASVVSDIILNNEIALESLRSGILNLSAYARQIQPEIEKKLYKHVRIGTIVTALSRLIPEVSKIPQLRPPVKIEDISIKSPLIELSFDKSSQLIKEVNSFRSSLDTDKNFFTVTQGFGEITIIMPELLLAKALANISQKPKSKYTNLVAVNIRIIASNYIETPNMIYSLVATLAARRINLIEIISTYTEISFIVEQSDMEKTVDVLKNHF